jgi:hypothetical protein
MTDTDKDEAPQSNHVHLEGRSQAVASGGARPTAVTADMGAAIEITAGSFRVSGGDAQFEVIRAPFSEAGIAAALARDPEFCRWLLHSAAARLRREAERHAVIPGQGNIAAVIKAELNDEADKFEKAAAILQGNAPDRFAAAAKIVAEIRDQIAGFVQNHQELSKTFLELTGVVFASYALHQLCGATGETAAFVAYAVVRKEKLSDIIAAWRGGKKDDDK